MAMPRSTTSPRLAAPQRRDHLLDTTAELLMSGAAVTMEGVAGAAGVSKALPYRHFDNAADLLVALHDRELAQLAVRVTAAVSRSGPADRRLAAGVHAFFDVLAERGVLLGILGSRTVGHRTGGPDRRGPRFVSGLLEELYGLDAARGALVAETMLGALLGAVHAWSHGDASRQAAETFAIHAASAIAAAGRR